MLLITNQGNRIVDQGLIGVYADVPQWGEWLIGSVLITQLPPGATRSVRLPWNTSGYHGVARLILRADPYRRLDERNTQNNQLSFEIALQPPLIQVFVPLLRR